MNRHRAITVAIALAILTGPSSKQWLLTGDPLIDTIIALEDPSGPCATIQGTTSIYKPDRRGVPGALTPDLINDPAARTVAMRIAVQGPKVFSEGESGLESDAGLVSPETVVDTMEQATERTFGKPQYEHCLMHLNAPAYSEGFAFVGFSNPYGQIGFYVFRKVAHRWQVIERGHQGSW